MLMPMLPTIVPVNFQSAFSQALNSAITLSANSTLLAKIFPGAFGGRTGTHLKIIVTPPTTGSLVIAAARVGFLNGSANSAISYDGNQLACTWDGGQAGGTFTLGSPQPVPDEIPFAIPNLTKAVLFAFDVTSPGKYMQRSSLGSNYRAFVKGAGAQEAANTTKSGYTSTADRLLVIGQLLIGSAG